MVLPGRPDVPLERHQARTAFLYIDMFGRRAALREDVTEPVMCETLDGTSILANLHLSRYWASTVISRRVALVHITE